MAQSEKQSLPAGMLAAAGIVFGDIGTSPLYTLKECLSILPSGAVTEEAVMGFLSLIFWGLMLIVTVKYVMFIMRADHDGEGGILTLMSLARQNVGATLSRIIVLAGLTGGAFFTATALSRRPSQCCLPLRGSRLLHPRWIAISCRWLW